MFLLLYVLIILIFQEASFAQQDLLATLASRPEVSQFLEHLKDSKVNALATSKCTNSETCITVLAPNNAAWNSNMAKISWPSLTLEEKQYIIYGQYLSSPKTGSVPVRLSLGNWQTAGTPLNLIDVGFGKGCLFTEIKGPRYSFSSHTPTASYFINDAKVINPDVSATNGIIQVMDKVVYYPDERKQFYNYLQDTTTLSKTFALWKKLLTNGNPLYVELTSQVFSGVSLYATYFVVPDSIWNQLPPNTYTNIFNNETLLVETLSYHYAPNQIFYPRWTEGNRQLNVFVGFPSNPLPTSLSTSTLTPGSLSGTEANVQPTVTVKSTIATTIGDPVVLNRAVLIQVSAPLGYLYENTKDALARISPTFMQVCMGDVACKTILDSTAEKSIFAPADWTAFNSLPMENRSDYLRLMIFSEKILRPQMTDDKYLMVGTTANAVRFRSVNGILNIECRLPGHGYVGAALTDTESSATDGVVYLITGVPGLATKTCQQMIMADATYTDYANTGILPQQKIGAPYTYFAPTAAAMTAMKGDALVGATILAQQDRAIYVMRRLIFPVQLILNEMISAQNYEVPTANFAFTRESVRFLVSTVSGQNEVTVTFNTTSTTASFATGGYECTDGWIYPVQRVLYIKDDITRSLCTVPHCTADKA